MKLIILTLFSIIMTCKGSEQMMQTSMAPSNEEIRLLCITPRCSEKAPLSLYEFNGIGFDKIKEAEKIGNDSFLIKVTTKQDRFLYVGVKDKQKRPVIFNSEKEMELRGICGNMRGAVITGSEANKGYDEIMKRVRQNQRELQTASSAYRVHANNEEKRKQALETLAVIDQRQMAFLDSLKKKDPFLAKVAALNTYLSFPNNKGDYKNEVDYFAGEFFRFVDFKDPDYSNIPAIFEAFKNFSQTMASVGFPSETVSLLIEKHLGQLDHESRAYRYSLGGVVIGLQAKNNPAFSGYAKNFIKNYEATTDPAAIKRLKSQLNQSKSFVTGAEAPDFTQKTPEGEEIALSSLKGNIVLIDFWASWCGPCRKENPNVVRLYEKYKDQGFEILGVSLDKELKRWKGAIEKDGLEWKHVSDLKGWKNAAAQTYGVRSIPHTVLLDKEGKIIARNLRGATLERKLAEIFKKK